jgi:hypothetical protein
LNCAKWVKSTKLGTVTHFPEVKIFRYGGIAEVPPGGRWRHLYIVVKPGFACTMENDITHPISKIFLFCFLLLR